MKIKTILTYNMTENIVGEWSKIGNESVIVKISQGPWLLRLYKLIKLTPGLPLVQLATNFISPRYYFSSGFNTKKNVD